MPRTHADLDPAGVPAYLEAKNEDNIRLYGRAGYRDMDPVEIFLPDGTPFYRMWRRAGASDVTIGGGVRPSGGRHLFVSSEEVEGCMPLVRDE